MKFWLAVIGTILVLSMLASSGALAGDICLAKSACVGANKGGVTFHAKGTP